MLKIPKPIEYEINLIPDETLTWEGQYLRLGTCKSERFVSIAPSKNENYGHYGWWRAKLAAEKLGYEVRAYTHMNQLPLAYPMADVLFLCCRDDYVRKMYIPHNDTLAETYHWHPLQNEIMCKSDYINLHHEPSAAAFELANVPVTDEEIAEKFFKPKLHIRKSTYDLFNSLDLPSDIIVCELRADELNHWHGQEQDQMRRIYLNKPIFGIDQEWQRNIISQVGDHWLGIQVLGSLLKNWLFVCVGGSANLHMMLPTRCLFLKDQEIRTPDLICRIGGLRNWVPVVGTCFWSQTEIIDRVEELRRLTLKSPPCVKIC